MRDERRDDSRRAMPFPCWEGGAGDEKIGGVERGWMNWDEVLRRLGTLRGIEDVEYVADSVRAAGVAGLFLDCDDIAALHSSTQNSTCEKVDGEVVQEWTQIVHETLARIEAVPPTQVLRRDLGTCLGRVCCTGPILYMTLLPSEMMAQRRACRFTWRARARPSFLDCHIGPIQPHTDNPARNCPCCVQVLHPMKAPLHLGLHHASF